MVIGGAFALGAALTFGGTTPLVQRAGRGVGAFTTAALLYAGSGLIAAIPSRSDRPPLARADLGRLVTVTLFGAILAPIALAWGLQRTSGVTASLLLNLEALFTVLLARLLWHEPVGRRTAMALAATLAGGALLVQGGLSASAEAGWGAVAVVVATMAWAADSVLSRPLSERNLSHVVLGKGVLGATATFTIARVAGEPWPSGGAALGLAACGAVGYGISLRMYLNAQRSVGAARTGTIFAAAPFVGAAVAWALGERAGGPGTIAAAALCAAGVALQLGETHDHEHTHPAESHDHPHRHDDGHHDHTHDVMPEGAHSHPHEHERVTHEHAHGQDVDHRHEH